MDPAPTIDVPAELARMEASLADLEALRPAADDRDGQGAHAPTVSGWSVAQHLYHIALATDLSLGHVRRLVDGSPLVSDEGALGPDAAEVLAREEQPRGVAEAPRIVQPGDRVEPAFLANEQAGNRELLAGLATRGDEIAAATGWIKHQDLGTLQAAQWLRFAVLHARHHIAIARDVVAAAAD